MKDLEDILIMDLAAVPHGWTATKVIEIMKSAKIFVVDTSKGGQMPRMMQANKKLDFKVVEFKEYKGE